MPRTIDYSKREEIITRASAVLAHQGLEVSLRALATHLGTTSRMLVHYFGSRERLVTAITDRVRECVVDKCANVACSSDLRESLFSVWDEISSTGGNDDVGVRLFIQLMAASATGEDVRVAFADELYTAMTDTLRRALTARDVPFDLAEFRAATAVAALQGLLTQRLTVADHSAVDAAFRRFIEGFVLAPSSPRAKPLAANMTETLDERIRQRRRH